MSECTRRICDTKGCQYPPNCEQPATGEMKSPTAEELPDISISREGLQPWHIRHIRATEEMARAHADRIECIKVLLEFHPEMRERTEPLSVLLREIFQNTPKPDVHVGQEYYKQAPTKGTVPLEQHFTKLQTPPYQAEVDTPHDT